MGIKRIFVFGVCFVFLVGSASALTAEEYAYNAASAAVDSYNSSVDSAASAEEAAGYADDAAASAEEASEYAEIAMEAADLVSQASVMSVSDAGSDEELVAVYSTLDPVTPENANGLKAILLDLIGDYESIVVEYEYENNNGYTSYVREIYPDYTWLCSCAIFLVMLYCTYRLGASILCKR